MTTTTVNLADLRQALRVAIPFADRTGMPVMESVHLEAAGNNLAASASDRYVLGHLRILATGDPLPSTLLHYRRARVLRRALDDMPGNQAAHLRRIRKLDGPDCIEVATDGLTMRVEVVKGDYPDVPRLFEQPADKAAGLADPLNLRPELIRPFAKAATALGVADVRWTFHGPKSPVRVEIGRTFAGLAMPRTFPRGFDPAPVPIGLRA